MRKIIHCDCDSFFASVEIRDNPQLASQPLAVGGSGPRSVVATCNYLARNYGIHSAMSMAKARQRCNNLVTLPANIEKYRKVSQQIQAIFYDYSDLVEPLSLDEAFIDVTDNKDFYGSATLIAQDIRRRVEEEVGITVSAGVANSKFLAKIASDWQKPNGLTVIRPEQVDVFVAELSVAKIFGVGKVTEKKLNQLGVFYCADLRRFSVEELVDNFGRFGRRLYELCRGIDHREVKPHRARKSISVENTYDVNLNGIAECVRCMPELLVKLNKRIDQSNNAVIIKQFVKVRFSDFTTTTVEAASSQLNQEVFEFLLHKALKRSAQSVRLLGLGVRLSQQVSGEEQLILPL